MGISFFARSGLFRVALCACGLSHAACSSDDQVTAAGTDAGADGQRTSGGSPSTGGASATTGGATASNGGATVGSGGARSGSGGGVGTGGRLADGGAAGGAGGAASGGAAGTGAGGRPADAGRTDAAPLNPACASADSRGFFPSCAACIDQSNCDSVDTGGGARFSCGCTTSGDCPCGLSCGCIDLAPGVQSCGVCTR